VFVAPLEIEVRFAPWEVIANEKEPTPKHFFKIKKISNLNKVFDLYN